MRLEEVKQLQNGDQVTWTNPENCLDNKIIEIKQINISGAIVQITDVYGEYLECWAEELS